MKKEQGFFVGNLAEKERMERERKAKKRKRGKRALIACVCVVLILAVFFSAVAVTNIYGNKANLKKIEAYEKIGCELVPFRDPDTGWQTFVTDGEFKILQLTDVHIGGGAFSLQKDSWALDAVYTLIKRVKPDLVIVTGDVAYPVPFQSGTFNNMREAECFATLMERCEVYWTLCFGNHDTEAYSMYNREEISKFYSQEKWKYCLFEEGDKDVDGYGNYVINVKNTAGVITHSAYVFDSHSYVDGDYFGIAWKYDNIHENQIAWYESEVKRMDSINEKKGGGKIKSTAYFHIPLTEFKTAWKEYSENGNKDTENVKLDFGVAGEDGNVVYCGIGEDNLFETMLELGSTVGVFCGHDHLNNFSVFYKGIRLTYGMSIDYLAYPGIYKKTAQRGGTVITVSPEDGDITVAQERLLK